MFSRALNYLIALILNLAGPLSGQGLPDWFFSPPSHQDQYYGIGVSNRYSDHDQAYSDARIEAIYYIAQQIELRIISGLADVSSGSKGLTREFIKEQVDTLLIDRIAKNIVSIDSVVLNNEAYMLIVINKDISKVEQSYYHINKTQKKNVPPKWVKYPPTRNGYIYGIGLGSRHKNTKDTWNDSVQNARLEIAQQKKSTIGSLYLNATQKYNQDIEWIEEKTDTVLKNSRVIERWHDKRTDIFYTLVEHKKR